MYINLLHLPLFNFACLFFLSFLSFLSSQHVCYFCFHCFIPYLASCFSFVSQFCFSLFCSGRYNFWFLLLTGSIYCTLFLLDCFDFAYGRICICVYSITFFCCCYKLLPLRWAFAVLWSFPFFFSLLYNFNFFKCILFFLHLFLCLPFLLFFSPWVNI